MAIMEAEPDISSWSYGLQAEFCLCMGFIQGESDEWISRQPAGPAIAPAFDEYVAGLRMLKKAATQLIECVEEKDIGAGRAGADLIKQATPHLQRAIGEFKNLAPELFD